jgi:mannosylglycoprotein endo-beta-mannosidase
MVRVIQSVESPPYAEELEKPITEYELLAAIRKGATNKAPGVDGLGIDFYKVNWEIIGPDLLELMNHMFLHQMVTLQQKHGIIVCLLKDNGTHTPAGYRPITLITTEYKLLARIMVIRLHLVL